VTKIIPRKAKAWRPTIRSDIPVPENDRISWAPTLKRMKVGDSFLLPKERGRTTIINYGRAHGMKFKMRRTEEGFRCWRVE